MAQTSLPATGTLIRRRTLFGLLDADGWTWAGVKAVFWFVVIVTMLGYIPDRAYYFTVGNTVDIWPLAPFMQWAPINFCPPANESLPCPAPAGATLPWHLAPQELLLPGGVGRTAGTAAVIGQTYVFTGGSDGRAATATTFISHTVGQGNFDKWSAGPALPEARSDAASAVLGSTLYLIGGFGPDGKPTSTVYSLTVANDGTIGPWKTEDALALPGPRAGASAIAVSDGIVVFGGTDGTAAQKNVWKTQQDSTSNTFSAWKDQAPLAEANMDGFAAHVGDLAYVVGGTNDKGTAVATVQEGAIGGPTPSATDPNQVVAWRYSAQTNLPSPRSGATGFVSNGQVYVVGGTDGTKPLAELLWATPDATGAYAGWNHLPQTDLPEGITGSAGVVAGPYAFIMGGQTANGVTGDAARAYLAPALPFFELGILGATIPALKLGGDIGQQIGYLNAAGVGTVNFIVLILIGVGFAHKEQVRAFIARRLRRGRDSD